MLMTLVLVGIIDKSIHKKLKKYLCTMYKLTERAPRTLSR